jgi:hypothetical protein
MQIFSWTCFDPCSSLLNHWFSFWEEKYGIWIATRHPAVTLMADCSKQVSRHRHGFLLNFCSVLFLRVKFHNVTDNVKLPGSQWSQQIYIWSRESIQNPRATRIYFDAQLRQSHICTRADRSKFVESRLFEMVVSRLVLALRCCSPWWVHYWSSSK